MTPSERERYARHLLLPEIGLEGQAKLCAAFVRLPASGDAGARAVAQDYLARAGVRSFSGRGVPGPSGPPHSASDEGHAVSLPDGEAIEALAGSPELVHAARALVGALAAVETVKAILELGRPLSGLPTSLSSEDV